MNVRDVKLCAGMTKEEVFIASKGIVELHDDVYLNVKHKHNWKCKCGNIIKDRSWDNAKRRSFLKCEQCKYNELEDYYREEVEKDGEYDYIRSYRNGDTVPSGLKMKSYVYLEMIHKYCGETQIINSADFINRSKSCRNCCDKYENSFAHYIEVELGEPLEKYWDYEKNTLNPYRISKGMDRRNGMVWIKCQEKDYHESYETSCDLVIGKRGCPYCNTRKKIHPKDSFAQYHIDNTDKDFLEKYWDYDKNVVSPWEIPISSGKKIWIKCQNEEINKLNGLMKKDYHGSHEITVASFTKGNRCHYCNMSKTHTYDSFGYRNLDKVMSWHPCNNDSPFKFAPNSLKRYTFVCEECSHEWITTACYITKGSWCPVCSKSKGEKKIRAWLDYNNIEYVNDEPYFSDLVGVGGNPLRPDFILPEYEIWIEYDGEFHYRKMYSERKHEILLYHDKLKNEYAEKHGWKMIRIKYTNFDNIEEILKEKLINKNKLI